MDINNKDENNNKKDYIQVIRCINCSSYHASCPLHSMEDDGYCYKASEYIIKNKKEKA